VNSNVLPAPQRLFYLENIMSFQAVPENEAASRLLEAKFCELAVNESITHHQLSDIVRFDIRKKSFIVCRARRNAMKRNVVIGSIRGVGYKRLDDSGIAGDVSRHRSITHRAALRGIRKSEKLADMTKLNEQQRTRFLADSSILSVIAYATTDTSLKKLEVRIEKTQAKLPLAETLDAFR
jgi:hypothetical protein